ncbi:MurR/RpiR family transcriptional regulator [Brachyspira hampsonii]|uniref:MurR/RpiR family transcriptional regulator n=1 Tax=Brachyspira hampsonii TaxID=1287055 RepID=UPI002406A497|nr:MurR/RpiR family transcriptional regulator [Brachyspira hampsonii]
MKYPKKELSYTKTEKLISEYILKLKENIISYSSFDLAKELGVSQSAIMKFIKKTCGVGFTEFKILLIKEYDIINNQERALNHDNISLTDSLEKVSRAIISESITSLSRTLDQLKLESVKECIDAIDSSNRIFLAGLGASSLPAFDLSSKLMKIGITAIWYQDTDSIQAAAFSAKPNDLFIVFSYSGKTKKILNILKTAKENDAKVALITKNISSPQSEIADIVIEIISNETDLRTSAMSSRIVFFSIVDILFLGTIKKDINKRLELVRNMSLFTNEDKL